MYQEVSKTEEIIERLKAEGKYHLMDSEEDFQKILEMNEFMEDVRRDYINKSARSWKSAEDLVLRNN